MIDVFETKSNRGRTIEKLMLQEGIIKFEDVLIVFEERSEKIPELFLNQSFIRQ